MRVTACLTSLRARSVLVSSLKMTVVTEIPSVIDEVMWRTPSTPETPSSIVFVTWASSSAGVAPNGVTTTDTTGISAFGRRVIGSLLKLVQPSSNRMIDMTIEGRGRRIDQAEMFSAIAAFSVVRFVDENCLHLIAIVQRSAGIGDDDVALLEPVADFKTGIGREPDTNPPRLDRPIAHHLHACSLGLTEDRVTRHGDAAALAGIDRCPGEHPDPKRWILGDRQPGPAELCGSIYLGRYQADLSDQFGAVFELDPRRFPGFELRHMDAGHIGLEFDFVVDHDAEQRLTAGRCHRPDASRRLRHEASGGSLQRDRVGGRLCGCGRTCGGRAF